MLVENEEKLKDWITRDITPLCDADPDAMARYVVALLKKDIDMVALKIFCSEQLDVFLHSQTVGFVDRLFEKLTDKSYTEIKIPSDKSPKKENSVESLVIEESDTEINQPTTEATKGKEKPVRQCILPPRGVVKVLETKPVRLRSPSYKERKWIEPLSPMHTRRRQDNSRSRSPSEKFVREKNHKNRLDIDKKRVRCKDFDERGFCMQGNNCQYDHGPDLVVVDESVMEKMIQTKTATGSVGFNGNASTAYSALLNPQPSGLYNIYSNASGLSTISEEYNPEAPSINVPVTMANIAFSDLPLLLPQRMFFGVPGSVSVKSNLLPQHEAYDPIGQQQQQNFQGHTLPHQTYFGGGGYRGRDGYFGGVHRPPAISKSLQVKRIPLELNNIVSLIEHFGEFGTVTNIQLRFDGALDSALVTFSTRQEAQAALYSTEPILNNRFIKVFWHNPVPIVTPNQEVTEAKPAVIHSPPAGTVPVVTERIGATSKTYVAQEKVEANGDYPVNFIGSSKKSEDALLSPIAASRINRNKEIDRKKKLRLLDVHRRKMDLYKKQIEQEKLLLEKIQKSENVETKKKLYTLFKTLDTSSTKKELEDLWEEIQGTTRVEPTKFVGLSSDGAAKKRKRVDNDNLENEVPRKVQMAINCFDTVEIEPDFMRVLNVLGCDLQYQDDLIFHMEQYGDLFDMEFMNYGQKAIFHYKNIDSAKKAFEDAPKSFVKCPVTVEWALNSKIEGSIVPASVSLYEDDIELDRPNQEPVSAVEESEVKTAKDLVFDDEDLQQRID